MQSIAKNAVVQFDTATPSAAQALGRRFAAAPSQQGPATTGGPLLAAFVSALKTPDLRRKILFTLAMVAVYRLGATLPSPGVDYAVINACAAGSDSSLNTVLHLFSGGALLKLSIFALGIMPYITASIIIQLLTVVIPRFEQL